MPHAFIKRAGDAFASDSFAEVELLSGDTVARLAARACAAFPRWGVDAGQVQLFLAAAGADAPSQDAIAALIDDPANRLGEAWPLARAGVAEGAWLLARVPAAAHGASAARRVGDPTALGARTVFEDDITLLESALRRTLLPAQRDAFRSDNFNGVRAAIREGRYVSDRASNNLLVAQLDGLVRTTTLRRLSTAESGLYLDGLLAGAGARGRAADIFCAVRVADGAVGAAKVFYAPPPGVDDDAAEAEHAASRALDEAAAAAGAARARVVRYSNRYDLGRGRAALFMPLYVRSLFALVHGAHVGTPLPPAFLLRAAADVLRGLALMHAAGLAHCDVKADNIMFDGAGAATLIDLGAATRLGARAREGAPEELALGRDASVASAVVDLACLAATLWWAARREAGEPAGATAAALAARADAAGDDPIMRAVAAILRAASAAEALAALEPADA